MCGERQQGGGRAALKGARSAQPPPTLLGAVRRPACPPLQLTGRWVQHDPASAAQPAQLPRSLQQCLEVARQAAAHLLPARRA